MTKFLKYLNEGRTKTLKPDDVLWHIKDNCNKNYQKIFVNKKVPKIYRGIADFSDDFGFVDTEQGRPRESAHTYNYGTLIMDNLPSWKSWPKRSKGLVCSTDKMYGSNFGQLFYIIPFDSSKIAVAAYNDIWWSFDKFQKDFGDIDEFNHYLHDILRYNKIKIPKTYNDIVNGFKTIQERIKNNEYITDKKDDFFLKYKDPLKHLNDVLDPKKNGFKQGIDNVKSDKEIWIQGKSIVISENGIDMIKEDLDDMFLVY